MKYIHILGSSIAVYDFLCAAILQFRLHKSTNDYQEAMKLVDKQYLKIIEVQQIRANCF